MRMNELLHHAATWMNLANNAKQRSQTPKSTYCTTLLRESLKVGKAYGLQYNSQLQLPLVMGLVSTCEGDTGEPWGAGNILFIHQEDDSL